MNKPIWILVLLFCVSLSLSAQSDDPLKKQIQFLEQIKDCYEGYGSSETRNLISYHSLRNDINEGMLTRATTGSMGIEWQTKPLPAYLPENGARFIWLAAIDITDKKVNFDVFIDGVKRFTIPSGRRTDWKISNPEGGVLSYQHFDSDQHGDSHGYMTLFAPNSWLKNNRPLTIKILGEAAAENTWIIVYKAEDIVSYLEKSTEVQQWLDVVISKTKGIYEIFVKAPEQLAGQTLTYRSGDQAGSVKLKKDRGFSTAYYNLGRNARISEFSISDDHGELVYFPGLQQDTLTRRLLPEAVLISELSIGKRLINGSGLRIYKPKTVKSILALSNSRLNNGKIYLMNSSHQDIAWMDSPENCVVERDTMLITPLIEQAKVNPDYRFDIEDALMIKEYIERHPGKKETIKSLLKEGKISCGSSYIQPYEEMYSGEALVRQFYFGRKWLKDAFNYDANTYWNVDVPGRTLQMPQILKKSGSPFMMISRHEKGVFNWYSPDGSFVTAYSPGHYSEAYTPLHKSFFEAAEYLAGSALDWEGYFSKESPDNVIPVLSDWDMSPANDYSHIIREWESISELRDKGGSKKKVRLPEFKISTAPEFLEAFVSSAKPLPSVRGERPALWLYIHGPSHQKALRASREGDILLTMAEKFATIDAMINGSFDKYPAERLTDAWEAKIYPDHGWGGKNGHITDALFRKKFEFASNEARQLLENAVSNIAAQIKNTHKKWIPVVVFNSLNWERNDVASFDISFEQGKVRSFTLLDPDGNDVPFQLKRKERHDDGSIRSAKLVFVAEAIPSVGYKTYYIKPSRKESKKEEKKPGENPFYTIEFSDGGLKSIFDKTLDKELLNPENFAAGEVFTMRSKGHGAGEFAAIQQPDMEGFDKTGNHPGEWEQTESGPVFTAWVKQTKLPHTEVKQTIILYNKVKRIDFDIELLDWKGVLYREFRMAVPLNMENGQVAYEVPFGVVEVGKDEMEGAAGERYNVPAKDLHPRGIENWIGASGNSFGATLSSSVAVADYLDPTNGNNKSTILQPLLLASRRSCHGEGNEYLQAGNHDFSFSLFSHQPGWTEGGRAAKQANEELVIVVGPNTRKGAGLPEEQSFFSFDHDEVIISTIKKAEDDNTVIVRLYDVKGVDREVILNVGSSFSHAVGTNLIEEEITEIPLKNNMVRINLGHHAIETIKLK